MTLKEREHDEMSVFVKEFLDSPEDFLKNKDKNVVIATIVALSENQSDPSEFLVFLAKCMKVYPNCWQYVRCKLHSEKSPFQSILEEKDKDKTEPPPKRRKTRKYKFALLFSILDL